MTKLVDIAEMQTKLWGKVHKEGSRTGKERRQSGRCLHGCHSALLVQLDRTQGFSRPGHHAQGSS